MAHFTYDRKFAAHYAGRTITIPDQVASNQREWDSSKKAFPAIDTNGGIILVCLDGDSYGLHTAGTGDCVCRSA